MPSKKGHFFSISNPPVYLLHAEPRGVSPTVWKTYVKLSVTEELKLKDMNVFEVIEKMQREVAELRNNEQQRQAGPSGCHWADAFQSRSADLAEVRGPSIM